MRFLIDNYATQENTQPLYFYSALKSLSKCEAYLRNANQSIYDYFDRYNPDVYITHAGLITPDLLHYTKSNPNKKINILISVYGMDNENINKVDEGIKNNELPCKFLFSNKKINVKNNKTVVVNNAADENIIKDPSVNYNLDKAVFVFDSAKISDYDPPYHIISNNNKLIDSADIIAPELYLAGIYSNYKQIIFEDLPVSIPQAFFDALLFCDSVYYQTTNNQVDENMKKIFPNCGSMNYKNKDRINDFADVKKIVKAKHTGTNRLLTLLSQIACNDIIEEIKANQ